MDIFASPQPPGPTLPPGPQKSSCALRKVRHRGLKVYCFPYLSGSDPSLSLRHSSIPTSRRLPPASGDVSAPPASPGSSGSFGLLPGAPGSGSGLSEGASRASAVDSRRPPPKWFCFRYLVRVFFLSHKFGDQPCLSPRQGAAPLSPVPGGTNF